MRQCATAESLKPFGSRKLQKVSSLFIIHLDQLSYEHLEDWAVLGIRPHHIQVACQCLQPEHGSPINHMQQCYEAYSSLISFSALVLPGVSPAQLMQSSPQNMRCSS